MGEGSFVINRLECEELRSTSESLLLYGRRKTGKTWLARNCVDWDLYVLVTREGSCIVEPGPRMVGWRTCIKYVLNKIKNNKIVILDEFQRLKPAVLDAVAHALASNPNARLILAGSSMQILDRVFSRRSPLLGLLIALKIDIIRPEDVLVSLTRKYNIQPSTAVKWLGAGRDPWIYRHLTPMKDPVDEILRRWESLAMAASGLVGEVFTEEERQLSKIYDSILKLLAKDIWSTKEIAAKLYVSGLITSSHPSNVTSYLDILEKIGLIKKIKLWKTRNARYYYRHRSTLLALLYYLIDYSEAGIQPDRELIKSIYYKNLQFDLGEMLASRKNLIQAYTIRNEWDLDIVLLDRKGRPQWAYEVKTGSITRREAVKTLERARNLGVPRVGLISLRETPPVIQGVDEVLGPEELVDTILKID